MRRMIDGNNAVKDVNKIENGIKVTLVNGTEKEIEIGGGTTVEYITITPAIATSGTLTEEQLSSLVNSRENKIILNDEIYSLADEKDDSGYLVYTHVGEDSIHNFYTKCITITISTRGWIMSSQKQAQFEQVIVKVKDCISHTESTDDYILFEFNFNVNTFLPIQIVKLINGRYTADAAISFIAGRPLKYNNTLYETGAVIEDVDGMSVDESYFSIFLGREEFADFTEFSERNPDEDEYYFILYKVVGNTKCGAYEI